MSDYVVVVGKAVVAEVVGGEDEVVDEADVEEGGGLLDFCGQGAVFAAGGEGAGGVVVAEDDG